jgi:DNA-binding CsgD family transcriptional regulator
MAVPGHVTSNANVVHRVTRTGTCRIGLGTLAALAVDVSSVDLVVAPAPMTMWHAQLAYRIAKAHTFPEVGAVVCEHARTALGVAHTVAAIFLGAPPELAITVDNIAHTTNEHRLARIQRPVIEPLLARVLEHHGSAGMNGMRWIPLVEPVGLLGYIRCEAARRLTLAQQRDLDVMGAYASARLVQVGVTVANVNVLDELTPRQREVAGLAAEGRSNKEIANTVGASVNTIKKHLKTVFDQLGVQRRAELATRLARFAGADDLPPGVTRIGDVWITKAGTRTGTRRRTTMGRG